MTRTRRFLGGLSVGYVYQIVVTLVGLWLTAFLLRTIGTQNYGLWLVATQILGYLMLGDFGVVALLPRETAYVTGRAGGARSSPEVAELFGRTFVLSIWQLPLIGGAALVVWLLLPAEWAALKGPLGIVLVAFVGTFPLRTLHAVLQGLQDLAFLGTAQLITWTFSTATIAAMAVVGFGLTALTTGWIVGQLVSLVLWWYRLRSRFPEVLPRRLPTLRWAQAREYLGKSLWASVAQVAQAFLGGSDVLVIGKLLGPEAVVPYYCTGKLVAVLQNQPQMVMQAAAPALSELRTGESRQRLLSVCTALTRAMLIASGLVAAVVLATNAGFVKWWVGVDKYAGMRLTVALATVMLFRHWNTTAVYSIFAFGRERRTSITTLLDGLLTLGATFYLVPRLGLIGAPIGSLLGVVLVSLPFNLGGLAQETGGGLWRLVGAVGPWAWRFVLVAAIAVLTSPALSAGQLIWIILGASAIGILYAALMWPLALRDHLSPYVRPWAEPLLRLLRPLYEAALDVASMGRGIPWTINGVEYRIDPRHRHRMGAEYDRPAAEWLAARVRPGALALDVGANVGVYVLQFAHWSRPGGRVVAFEPNPVARAVLERHVRLNGLDSRAEIVPAAVSDRAGEAVLYAAGADGMSRLGEPNPQLIGQTTPMSVPVVTLDEFCQSRGLKPDWLFLDIEGFEIAALSGARRLLARPDLGVVVEMHPDSWSIAGSSRPAAEALLREVGRRAVPLSGQRDALGEYGHVWLERLGG